MHFFFFFVCTFCFSLYFFQCLPLSYFRPPPTKLFSFSIFFLLIVLFFTSSVIFFFLSRLPFHFFSTLFSTGSFVMLLSTFFFRLSCSNFYSQKILFFPSLLFFCIQLLLRFFLSSSFCFFYLPSFFLSIYYPSLYSCHPQPF